MTEVEFESLSREGLSSSEAFIVDIDGFEGPLDLLLALSRTQKVDLRKISVLDLAEQYLEFIRRVRVLRIELAADYLVMAAWLAFLKSRLLLPPSEEDEGPTGEELASYLAFQLERLHAMRRCAAQLMARDQRGRNFFGRGCPEVVQRVKQVKYTATLLDLTQGYARIKTRGELQQYEIRRPRVFAIEQALVRLRETIKQVVDWTDLRSFILKDWQAHPEMRRSVTASSFAAVLELAREGQLELRQAEPFSPLELKCKERKP
ncbi:MAG: ScpA family protein [Aestuariivita sp.]|nr:ScpA family protein [Aestuariivita sp.]MCY4345757.1 ScpA family protein [Aestuariivita sp.]